MLELGATRGESELVRRYSIASFHNALSTRITTVCSYSLDQDEEESGSKGDNRPQCLQ